MELGKSYNEKTWITLEGNYYVYVLLCEEGKYYIGIATNPKERLKTHKKGRGSKFTKRYKPLKIVEVEDTRTDEIGLANVFENQKMKEYRNIYGYEKVGGGTSDNLRRKRKYE